jgi:hypothetical protein
MPQASFEWLDEERRYRPRPFCASKQTGLRECANRSGSAAGSGVPAVKDPGPA